MLFSTRFNILRLAMELLYQHGCCAYNYAYTNCHKRVTLGLQNGHYSETLRNNRRLCSARLQVLVDTILFLSCDNTKSNSRSVESANWERTPLALTGARDKRQVKMSDHVTSVNVIRTPPPEWQSAHAHNATEDCYMNMNIIMKKWVWTMIRQCIT